MAEINKLKEANIATVGGVLATPTKARRTLIKVCCNNRLHLFLQLRKTWFHREPRFFAGMVHHHHHHHHNSSSTSSRKRAKVYTSTSHLQCPCLFFCFFFCPFVDSADHPWLQRRNGGQDSGRGGQGGHVRFIRHVPNRPAVPTGAPEGGQGTGYATAVCILMQQCLVYTHVDCCCCRLDIYEKHNQQMCMLCISYASPRSYYTARQMEFPWTNGLIA